MFFARLFIVIRACFGSLYDIAFVCHRSLRVYLSSMNACVKLIKSTEKLSR